MGTWPTPTPCPEWPVAWAAKEVLRRHLGPKFDRHLPLFLAKAILERMRLTKWRISKEPPDAPHSMRAFEVPAKSYSEPFIWR
jgi:hypothetical protein